MIDIDSCPSASMRRQTVYQTHWPIRVGTFWTRTHAGWLQKRSTMVFEVLEVKLNYQKSNSICTISSRCYWFIRDYARSILRTDWGLFHIELTIRKRLGCKLKRESFVVNAINLFLCSEIVSRAHILNLIWGCCTHNAIYILRHREYWRVDTRCLFQIAPGKMWNQPLSARRKSYGRDIGGDR